MTCEANELEQCARPESFRKPVGMAEGDEMTRQMTRESEPYGDELSPEGRKPTVRFGLQTAAHVGSEVEKDLLEVARIVGHHGVFLLPANDLVGGIRVPDKLAGKAAEELRRRGFSWND